MSVRLVVYGYVSDLEGMRKFYESALDVKGERRSRNWLTFELDGATFALHAQRTTEPPQDAGRFHVEFQVDDIDGAVAAFRAQGAKVVRGVTDEAYGMSAVLLDHDGREVRLVQEESPQSTAARERSTGGR